ncbi:LuxR C-terminal-related transcriptional regulator [Agromyces sp. NPDC056523]|uniref:LuxR C-terminal-related transcriptional regulator n=1 Tax=Agromyces sp. NPDC056523 TaxID=3345850 RepID=UPI00367153BE
MTASTALEAGRTAFAARRWAEAYERLALADAAGGLGPLDLETLATAAFLRGESAEAVDVLSRAHAAWAMADDAEEAARTAAWLALYHIELGDMVHYVEWAPRGLRLAEGLPASSSVGAFVRMPAAIAQMASGDPRGAAGQFREIEQLADASGDRDLGALARFGRGNALAELGEDEEGFACLDAAVAAVERGEVRPFGAGVILCTSVADALLGFDFERAVAWSAALDRWCREQPELVTYSGQRHALRAAVLLLQGSWSEAAASAELALSRFRAGDTRAVFGAPYYFGEVQRLRGAFHSAAESFRRAGQTPWDPQPGSALLHLAEGKVDRAREELVRTAAAADRFTRRSLLPALIDVEVAAGNPGAARRALEQFEALAGSASTPMFAAARTYAEARVQFAEGDVAAALLVARAAADAWRELGIPYEHARSRVLVGRAHLATGDAAQAIAEFDAARTIFRDLGAEPALGELADIVGGRRRSILTDREVEVLRLVSTGLTNRAIGEQLSLSEKTVARHLSNIFGKLGLSTRAAATAYAYENGLV